MIKATQMFILPGIYYNPMNGKLYSETSKYAKKTNNLRKNKNVYFCIDKPNAPYKGVHGKGIVVFTKISVLIYPSQKRY